MKPMLTLFVIRPKGFNVGNDVIYLGLQHFLTEGFGKVVNLISLPATARYESQAQAGLTSKTIYQINQFGDGVIVGGGNLYENGELDISLDALEALEVPLMLYSLSRGRVFNRRHELVRRTDCMPDRVLKALNSRANFSLARDQATYEYLTKIGCNGVQVGGCPTIFLDLSVERLPPLAAPDADTVLISVRSPGLMSVPLDKQSQVRDDIVSIVEMLRQDGNENIRLLCHDHRDIPFAASFRGLDYVYTGDVYTYLSLLRSCALCVSYRLHASLPCMSYRTPVINISYDQRASSLMETIGLGEWDISMFNGGSVVSQVSDRCRRLGELSTLREEIQPTWQAIYSRNVDAFSAFAAEVTDHHRANRIQ